MSASNINSIAAVNRLADSLCANISKVICGKDEQLRIIVAALLAQGHVLLEDVPGTGKTMLAKSLAKSVSAAFSRVQFTPDLLPGDITGTSIYDRNSGKFTFCKGPVFANILLADEINRATARTQSALLEAMEERQITADGTTYALGEPFFVIATQNSVETHGTFPLPEAQLDRFLIELSLGYPAQEDSLRIFRQHIEGDPYAEIGAVCTSEDIVAAQALCRKVYVHDCIQDYVLKILEASRSNASVQLGLSTRAGIAMLRAAQSYAAVCGRDYVVPEDVKALSTSVFAHRIVLRSGENRSNASRAAVISRIVSQTEVPVEKWKR